MKIIKNPFVVEKYQSRELFIVFDNKVYLLKNVSLFIWSTLEQGISEEQLLDKLVEEYEISKSKAAKDLAKFLSKMESIHVIEKQ